MIFRIYYKKLKEYSHGLVSEKGECFRSSGNGITILGELTGVEKIYPYEQKVELFSGLRDVNDVPIYEGDIIKYISHDDWFDKEGYETYGIVHFDKRYGTFTIWGDVVLHEFYKGSELYHFAKKSTVIGNVSQNPELVEKYFKK